MSKHVLSAIAGVYFLVAATVMCGRPPGTPVIGEPTPVSVLGVTSISPNDGPAGLAVTIRGTGFAQGAIATFDGVVGKFTYVTPVFMTVVVPEHENGFVDVAVRNPSGELATLTGGFRYFVPQVTLTASRTISAPGGTLAVSWEAPSNRSKYDWILLLKVGEPNTFYENGWWQYTGGVTSGTLELTAPTEPGVYDFRYLLDDGFVEVARSSPVTVQ